MSASSPWAERIGQMAAGSGLEALPEGSAAQFAAYLELLLKWNARLNLTAIREPEEMVRRHFLESIECARAIPPAAELPAPTVLDLGSGAGFPGIPIAILRPELEVMLAESQAKKSSFLREVVRTLGLSARVYDGRIETMAADRRFGAVALRAVDKMAEAAALAAGRVQPGGTLMLFATENTRATVIDAAEMSAPGFAWDEVALRSSGHGFLLRGHLLA